MSGILTAASRQFMSRPADERFTSLHDLNNFCRDQRERSRAKVVSSRKMQFRPAPDNKGILVEGRADNAVTTNWSFQQMAGLSSVPATLLKAQCEKGLAPLACDNLNAGFQVIRDIEDVGLLATYEPVQEDKVITIRAATGPRYGRIWNADITDALAGRFGNGVSGDWRVPGFFGQALDRVTKENTTLFASDRDMFVFLADEINRIEMPNRRAGQRGSLARGFFIKNSEVGSATCELSYFLFDFSCCNRIVWGVEGFEKISIRHTSGAPDRWLEEITPTLVAYSNSKVTPVEAKLQAAQARVLDNAEKFLADRFTPRQAGLFMAAHMQEEERPVETLWDAVTAVTAYARGIPNTNDRVDLEERAGDLLRLAA